MRNRIARDTGMGTRKFRHDDAAEGTLERVVNDPTFDSLGTATVTRPHLALVTSTPGQLDDSVLRTWQQVEASEETPEDAGRWTRGPIEVPVMHMVSLAWDGDDGTATAACGDALTPEHVAALESDEAWEPFAAVALKCPVCNLLAEGITIDAEAEGEFDEGSHAPRHLSIVR